MIYVTSVRRAILDTLRAERRYLTVAQLYEAIRRGHPNVALSTVYRTLGLLADLGAVSRRTGERGGAEFLYCPETHHHHAICRDCGRVADVDCNSMERVRAELRERHGFVLDDHEVTFHGRCTACQRIATAP